MAMISEEIDKVLKQADAATEKTAQNKEKGFSSGQEPSTISKAIGPRLKEASQLIRTSGTSVDSESVLQFVKELL